jgi:ribonuclease HII
MSNIDFNTKYQGYVFIDEAGRGCVGGELVFAGVKIKEGCNVDNANDSKKLNLQQRTDLVDSLLENVEHYVVITTASTIDEKGLAFALKTSLEQIISFFGVNNHFLYDGNQTFGVECEGLETLVKADALVKGVGAASIIAKHNKDRLMRIHHQEFPHYGWDSNAGYITKNHIEAIKKYGYTPYHRKSYKIKGLNTTK